MNEIATISSSESLQAVTAAEIDQQIATAHRYPRDVVKSLNKMQQLALMDEETAEDCFYHLERKGKDGTKTIIEGPSVRLAEIAAASWGNMRFASRVVGNDGRMVTVEAVAHDLESNVASSQQQVRSIVNKYGQTFTPDMQVMTINAASSVARRNAIYNVIPKAYINKLVDMCKEYVKGEAKIGLRDKIQKVVKAFAKYGVTPEMITAKCEVESLDDITPDMVVTLTGIGNALKDGATDVSSEFPMLMENVAMAKKDGVQKSAAEKAREILGRRKKDIVAEAPATPEAAQVPNGPAPEKEQVAGDVPGVIQPNLTFGDKPDVPNFDAMSDAEIDAYVNGEK